MGECQQGVLCHTKLESVQHIGLGWGGETEQESLNTTGQNMTDEESQPDINMNKHYGIRFNNEVWELLSKKNRSAEDDELMIHSAHKSYLHWCSAGTALHRQRGTWMLSHVCAQLGLGERALHYAKRCAALEMEYAKLMRDFDIAYASEAMARACAVSGDLAKAAQHYRQAAQDGDKIGDAKEKEIFLGDLKDGNWGEFQPEED